MSEDFRNKQSQSDNHILTLILTTLQSLGGHIISFDGRFTSLEARFTSLETRFDSLEIRFDRVEARCDRFEAEIRREIRDLNNTLADVSRNQTVLSDAVRKMDHNFHDVFERLHIVEVTGNQQNSTT
jgi:hypothetical protein